MDEPRTQPVCGQEALALLNCVSESPFDQEKCVRLMHSLRECVLAKKVKKFTITRNQQEANPVSKKS